MERRNELLSTDVSELIDPSDKPKIDEYLPFLRCYKCLEVMLEPKQCLTCNLNLCPKCHKQTCSHSLVQSRHLKSILEGLSFKCRNKECTKVLKYIEIRPHLMTCPFSPSAQNSGKSESRDKLSKSMVIIPEKKDSFLDLQENLNRSVINFDNNFEQSYFQQIDCKYCNSQFQDKNEYLTHLKNCANNGRNIVDVFRTKIINLQNTFEQYNKDKLTENITIATKALNEKFSTIDAKYNNMINLEIAIKKINNDEGIIDDPEMVFLKQEEERLKKAKYELQKTYQDKLDEYHQKLNMYEANFNEEISQYKETLTTLELEEKWLKEDMDNCIFITDSGICSQCNNNDPAVKKFFCQDCNGKYCINKCAKICKNQNCSRTNKYICPVDNKACNLCRKFNYCEDCKRKCFFQNCPNSFCPECYKKNEHQARSSNINCKFFTCEKDQVCDCLMTSIYCSKCEKRLCNKCLLSDIDHHNFLKD
jgi:hypothetical protein